METRQKARFKILLKEVFSNFVSNDSISAAAALSFYTALSLAPLVLFFVSLTGMAGFQTQEAIISEFEKLSGKEGGLVAEMIISNADKSKSASRIGSIISLLVLAFSASAVFAELQGALNKTFNVISKPNLGVINWLRKRLFSLGILVSLGFVMLVSLVASAVISALFAEQNILIAAHGMASLVVFVLFFAVIFKYLPDTYIAWKDVWIGALLTATFFSLGRSAIGFYLGNSAIGSAYGAAGSIIVFLAWVYYSCIILLFGAELTEGIARNYGSGVRPGQYSLLNTAKTSAI